MDALIDALLDWIGDHSDLRTTQIPTPIVLELTAKDLTSEYYTGVAHLIPEGGVDTRLNALYAASDGPEGTIYIINAVNIVGAEDFDDPRENPLWREILLHELVHHVQWHTGLVETWACHAQGETQAYHLGGQYLAQQNVDDPLPNRAFWARMYARC